MSLDQVKDFVVKYNKGKNFSEPLEDKEVEKIWKQALGFIARNEEEDDNQPPLELSISQALRIKKGHVKVKGQLIGQSTVYGMISAIGNITCWSCGTINSGKDYKKPVLSLKSELKNRKCINCEEPTSTEQALEYFATVDVELQDPDRFSEIERLSVHLFEKNTENIQVGEVVTIIGRIYMERKNDNGHNRPTPILYGESIEYSRKEQSKLSEKDIEEIQQWKALKEEAGINPIDALVGMFAPHVIGNADVKEGLLMTTANAGIPAQGSIIIINNNDIEDNNNDVNNIQEARVQKETITNNIVEPCRSNNVSGSKWRSDRADRSDSKKADYGRYVGVFKTEIDAALDDNNNNRKRHDTYWSGSQWYCINCNERGDKVLYE
jgi:hypothetical protein